MDDTTDHYFSLTFIIIMNIGYAIRLCRQQRGITQTKLANKAGVSVSYLSLLERGERSDPSLTALEGISEALELPLSLIFFLASEPDELEGLDPEVIEKLSAVTLKLMRHSA